MTAVQALMPVMLAGLWRGDVYKRQGQVLSFSAAGRYLSLLTGSGLEIYTRDMSLYRRCV